jgi:hypothetical protein
LMKRIPLFIPYCLRSKAIVPVMIPEPVPLPDNSGPVCAIFVDFEGDIRIVLHVEEIFPHCLPESWPNSNKCLYLRVTGDLDFGSRLRLRASVFVISAGVAIQ